MCYSASPTPTEELTSVHSVDIPSDLSRLEWDVIAGESQDYDDAVMSKYFLKSKDTYLKRKNSLKKQVVQLGCHLNDVPFFDFDDDSKLPSSWSRDYELFVQKILSKTGIGAEQSNIPLCSQLTIKYGLIGAMIAASTELKRIFDKEANNNLNLQLDARFHFTEFIKFQRRLDLITMALSSTELHMEDNWGENVHKLDDPSVVNVFLGYLTDAIFETTSQAINSPLSVRVVDKVSAYKS